MNLNIKLDDCTAHIMGADIWALCREEETPEGRRRHTVGLCKEDLTALMDPSPALSVDIEDGTADYMGDGMFVLHRRDERNLRQSVAISRQDLEALLAAA